MSEVAYTMGIGGKATRETLAELRATIAANQDLVDCIISNGGSIPDDEQVSKDKCFWLSLGRVSRDELCDVTEFCEEHDLAYVIDCYSTCSDSEFVELWRPGMEHAKEIDADEDFRPRVTKSHIEEGLAKLAEMGPVTADQIRKVFDEVLPSDSIPELEIEE